ncbi:MAG TPA: PHP domain-containing protein [Thermoanaerobaculia bacterium]|nr:PHP domain-containing protein [Thermoanaerobaculia bacterium]
MTRFADLHTHTHHSDGTRSPRELVDAVKSHGIDILAISDHDNLAAYFEVKSHADATGMTLIPAVELSCIYKGVDVHVLAYAFDALDEQIDARLRSFRETRLRRGSAMVQRLGQLGYSITEERVRQLAAGGAMGRPHVARALVEAGHVTTVAEAFDRLIGSGKPAYVEKERFQISEAVSLVRNAGGVTSVAHPSLYPDHAHVVADVLDGGIDGIEIFHPDVPDLDREMYRNMARFRGKMVTGGSDDHGTVKAVQTLGSIRVPEYLIQPILDRLR